MRANTLSKRRVRRIINCFATGLTAIDTSFKLKLHRNTVNKYYRQARVAIFEYQEEIFRKIDVSTIGQQYILSWHKNTGLCLGEVNQPNVLVFRVLAHNGSIFVLNEKSSKNIISDIQEDKQKPMAANSANMMQGEIAANSPKIINKFFIYSKEKLTKFYGVKLQYTYLYLKELEFRFNNHDTNLSELIWKIISLKEKQNTKKIDIRKTERG